MATIQTVFDIYQHVFIVENGEKIRECFITSITVAGKDQDFQYYHLQPCELSEEEKDDNKSFWWEKSWRAREIYPHESKALEAISNASK